LLPTSDLDGLKDLIAAHFAIVESSGKLEGNFFFIILGLDVPGGGDGLSKEIKLLCRHYA
jgi:hypothetical protein